MSEETTETDAKSLVPASIEVPDGLLTRIIDTLIQCAIFFIPRLVRKWF